MSTIQHEPMTGQHPSVKVREYQTLTKQTAYSVSYGNPDGYTILVTPERDAWIVWHSSSLGTVDRTRTSEQAIATAVRIATRIAKEYEAA